ncbi:MAG: hypothetical protein IT563_15510 [Alphaproteobacteria bacterium]|nr:hypothetical protein [Alphaproteobacteria bacterium]
MNRIALYAGALTLAFAAAAQAQTNPWPSIDRMPVDGRQLIAALDACDQVLEQSARAKCEMNVRKTGGQGFKLRVGTNEPTGQFDRFHP